MNTSNKNVFCSILFFTLVLTQAGLATAQYYQEEDSTTLKNRFYLGFSIGEGSYFSYKCTSSEPCTSVFVSPVDFEILLGFRASRYLYADLGINWAMDYSNVHYHKTTFLAGLRPGVRLVLPGPFRRHLYFRGAVPVHYTFDEENKMLFGVLLGIGIEWRFGNMGIFAEADITPYFVEVYPGYYVIPVEGRAGISVRF